jgi:hypothetical protein
MEVRIANLRRGEWGSALAFFDVVLDDALVVRGYMLGKSKAAGKWYFRPPSKLRTEKGTGKPMKDDNGYDIYDPTVDLWGAKKDGKFSPTQAAWDIRDEILRQAIEEYESASEAPKQTGRGGAKTPRNTAAPAPTATRAGTTTKVETGTGDGEFEDDPPDDDLPF